MFFLPPEQMNPEKNLTFSDFNLGNYRCLFVRLDALRRRAQLSHVLLSQMKLQQMLKCFCGFLMADMHCSSWADNVFRGRHLKSLNLRSSGWTVSFGHGFRAKQVGMFSGCSIQSLWATPACVRFSDRPERAASSGA